MRCRLLLLSIGLWIGLGVGAFADGSVLVKVGQDITVGPDETVETVVSIGGDVRIAGTVEEAVIIVGGDLVVVDGGRIDGEIVSVGGKLSQSAGAHVKQQPMIVSGDFSGMGSRMRSGESRYRYIDHESYSPGWSIVPTIGLFVIGLLILNIFPQYLRGIDQLIERRPLASFGIGFAGLIVCIPLALLLLISIFGIVLIPFEVLGVFLALMLGHLSISLLLGRRIVRAVRHRESHPWISLTVGILVLWVLKMIPLVGWFIYGVALVAGFGAVLSHLFATVKRL